MLSMVIEVIKSFPSAVEPREAFNEKGIAPQQSDIAAFILLIFKPSVFFKSLLKLLGSGSTTVIFPASFTRFIKSKTVSPL